MGEWSIGDICFFEYELSQVIEVKEGEVKEITTGYIRTSTGGSFNSRCFPVSMEVKLISEQYKYWSNRLHKEGLRELNFPDIHQWLVIRWSDACQRPKDNKWIEDHYSEVREFAESILEKSIEVRSDTTRYGFPLLRT